MYDKILLPVDLNEPASWEKALPTAVTLCRTFDAELVVVTVLPDFRMPLVGSYFPEGFEKKTHEAVHQAQREFIAEHLPEDLVSHGIVVDGSPWEAIVKVAKKLDVDLVVMASHNRRKFADYVLGPNAEHVVHHSKMSVMIVR